METRIFEIADDVFRLSTFVPDLSPTGFTFNQFLIRGDEAMLFHCGHRAMFPMISAAVAKLMPIEKLRWLSFGHIEGDECGAMNLWLGAAPSAQVAHGATACSTTLDDISDRPPRVLENNEVLDLGGKKVRWLDTPHVPHGWESGLIFEETGRTLFCGDLLAHAGDGPPLTRDDVVESGLATEHMFHAMGMGPNTRTTLERLAALEPTTLALMHGSSFEGDGSKALTTLADRLFEQDAG